MKARNIASIVLKLTIAVVAVIGVASRLFSNGFMGGKTLLLYFTIQSNLWLVGVCIALAIVQLRHRFDSTYCFSYRATLIQQVFTVSITLTGCVYCMVLLPSFLANGAKSGTALAYDQVFVHVLTPVLSIVDLLALSPCKGSIKSRSSLWAILPAIYYVIFSLIGFFCGWNFGGGNNYPYFFLNYSSPVGLFGFGSEMPYFMGSAYWLVALAAFILVISRLYILIVNRRFAKHRKL